MANVLEQLILEKSSEGGRAFASHDTGLEPVWRKARQLVTAESFALVAVGVNQG